MHAEMSLLTFERSRSAFKVICFEKDPPVTAMTSRGVATGVDIGIYTPKKSAQVNFLWGKK